MQFLFQTINFEKLAKGFFWGLPRWRSSKSAQPKQPRDGTVMEQRLFRCRSAGGGDASSSQGGGGAAVENRNCVPHEPKQRVAEEKATPYPSAKRVWSTNSRRPSDESKRKDGLTHGSSRSK